MTSFNSYHELPEPPAEKTSRVAVRDNLLDLLKDQPAAMSTGGQIQIYLDTSSGENCYTVPLDAPYLRGWLTVRHIQDGNPAPSDAQIRQALRVREAQCLGGASRNARAVMHVRYAWNPNHTVLLPDSDPESQKYFEGRRPTPAFILNLDTFKGRHAAVTSQNWTIEPTQTAFLYDPIQQNIQDPIAPEGDPEQALQPLRKLLRLDHPSQDEAWKTLLNWTLAAMRAPKNATFHDYPILNLMGPENSGKSVTAKLLTQLLDPTLTPIHSLPTTERRLHGLAANHHILTFDETGKINPEKSRYLSRLATGVTSLHRQLQGMLVRPIILTTTDETETRHLSNKVVDVELPPIDDPLTQEEIQTRFEALRAPTLGALLTLLVRNFDQPTPLLPNRKTKNQKIQECVTNLLKQNGGSWTGTATGLLTALSLAGQPSGCPRITAKALSQLLDEMKSVKLTRLPRKNKARPILLELPEPKPESDKESSKAPVAEEAQTQSEPASPVDPPVTDFLYN